MATDKKESFRIYKMLDANYALVIFGRFSGYSGDDVHKFIWMIRIAPGYYPRIKKLLERRL